MSAKAKDLPRSGDKKNSDFFEEYLQKIYLRREKNGLDDLLQTLKAVVLQIDYGELINYLAELYLMTPYRFHKGYETKSHRVCVLKNDEKTPDLIILEPTSKDYFDRLSALNSIFPRSLENMQARYIGEIYQTEDLKSTVKTLEAEEFRFFAPENLQNQFLANKNFRITDISYFTNNVVIYTESDLQDYDSLQLGTPFTLTEPEQSKLQTVSDLQQNYGLTELILGLDHLATRVLAGDREDAILEFLSLTNYYFWGAYDIEDMNSSTNICRHPSIDSELHSPAKVFTANNTPFYTKSIDGLPSPTEDFVRNFGKRMHHLAYAVIDGSRPDGMKNIDYVVGKLDSEDIPFLADVIGECTDFPDLKQIFSKSSKYSILITEYVQRCHGFEGFFTKDNVAFLTQAAGEDEAIKKADVCD